MKEIIVYLEGGKTAQQNAELRTGFDQLLEQQKNAARTKRLQWKLVPCGGRDSACKAFVNAYQKTNDQTLCVLLVDSEDELPPEESIGDKETGEERRLRLLRDSRVRRDHLSNRDCWDFGEMPSDEIHLMVRCMETWIVADPDALRRYYGNGFRENQLPVRVNLEYEPKLQIYDKLKKATKDTSKGEYAKIKHASKLLAQIDPKKIAARCQRFATFTRWLSDQIADA